MGEYENITSINRCNGRSFIDSNKDMDYYCNEPWRTIVNASQNFQASTWN